MIKIPLRLTTMSKILHPLLTGNTTRVFNGGFQPNLSKAVLVLVRGARLAGTFCHSRPRVPQRPLAHVPCDLVPCTQQPATQREAARHPALHVAWEHAGGGYYTVAG